MTTSPERASTRTRASDEVVLVTGGTSGIGADARSVTAGTSEVAATTPHLTTLVNNVGIQRVVDFSGLVPPGPAEAEPEIATNLTGMIHVTAAALRRVSQIGARVAPRLLLSLVNRG